MWDSSPPQKRNTSPSPVWPRGCASGTLCQMSGRPMGHVEGTPRTQVEQGTSEMDGITSCNVHLELSRLQLYIFTPVRYHLAFERLQSPSGSEWSAGVRIGGRCCSESLIRAQTCLSASMPGTSGLIAWACFFHGLAHDLHR